MTCVRSMLLPAAVAAICFASLSPAVAQQSGAPCASAPVADHGQAGNGKPLASPPETAETQLGGRAVTIHYNAPSVRCRTIMGGLVPYGKVWRTGANPATTLITATNLKIGTLSLPAGTYTLYTLPEEPGTPWQLIVNKQTGQWGTVYKQEMDLGRTPMAGKANHAPQELMSISFEDVHGSTAQLHVRWANADESVRVEAE